MVFADTTIMGYSKSIDKFVSGEMSLKGLLPRLITTPFIGLIVSGILDAILPGCTQKNQSFVLTPRSMIITLPAQELQEPSLITGTTGFETFTIPYEYELQPFLTYYYVILSPSTTSFSLQTELSFSYNIIQQESYSNTLSPTLSLSYSIIQPATYSGSLEPTLTLTHASNIGESEFSLSPSLSFSYSIIQQESYSYTLSPSLSFSYKILTPISISFNLQPTLTLYQQGTQVLNESASSSVSTPTANSVSESTSGTQSTGTANSVNESASGVPST